MIRDLADRRGERKNEREERERRERERRGEVICVYVCVRIRERKNVFNRKQRLKVNQYMYLVGIGFSTSKVRLYHGA